MGYQKEKKKTCIELLEKETTTCEMKNTLHGYNGKVDITEEKISEFESIAIETIQMKHPGKRKFFLKMNKASVNYGTTSIGQCVCNQTPQRKGAGRKNI